MGDTAFKVSGRNLDNEVSELIRSLNSRQPKSIQQLTELVFSGRLVDREDLVEKLITEIRFPHPAIDEQFISSVRAIFEYGNKEELLPDFMKSFVSRSDVILEDGAGLALCQFIEGEMLAEHVDLVRRLRERISAERSRILNTQVFHRAEGKYFAGKHFALEDRIIDALARNGFASEVLTDLLDNGYLRKFSSANGNVPHSQTLSVRQYYKADSDRAEAFRNFFASESRVDMIIDQIKRGCTGFNNQDYIDRFIPTLRESMSNSTPEVARAGRKIIAAILEKGYVVRSPIDPDIPLVRMLDPKAL